MKAGTFEMAVASFWLVAELRRYFLRGTLSVGLRWIVFAHGHKPLLLWCFCWHNFYCCCRNTSKICSSEAGLDGCVLVVDGAERT